MSSLFSSISGQFSKSLILGILLPVTIFVLLFYGLVIPLFPTDWPLLQLFARLEGEWRVVSLLFFIIVLSGLLHNLNTILIRFYEGYHWQWTGLAKRWVRFYQAKLDAANTTERRMRILITKIHDLQVGNEYRRVVQEKWDRASQQITSGFPQRSSVMPTRLGNVIRSFENYPSRQYGMSAITLWPRLIGKIEKGYATAIDDTKTSFDFLLNCSALSGALTLALFVVGLFSAFPLTMLSLTALWLFEILLFAVLAYVFYAMAITRASAWGAMVKGSVDLYRWALLGQFGFKRVPATMEEERALWQEISDQMIYGDPVWSKNSNALFSQCLQANHSQLLALQSLVL